MIAPLNFELNGESYQALPHAGFIALDLQRKVSALYTSIFKDNANLDDGGLFQAMTIKLGEMPKDDFKWLLENTLNQTTVTTANKANLSLNGSEAIAAHFSGRSFADIYALLFKVWELEKLGPFGLITAEPGT